MTPEQQRRVNDLSRDPVFTGILREMDSHARLPKWKKTDDSTQSENWIYRSGYVDGIEFVLKLLGYEDD